MLDPGYWILGIGYWVLGNSQVASCGLGFFNGQSSIVNLKPLYLLDGKHRVQVVDEDRIVI